tara:strand:- start:3133 stop:3342 length:210 start_codon:yes stop_codon:yes gene_type:complete
MLRRAVQVLGLLVILGAIGFWWLLDLYGCAFNTSGCARILPRPTREAMLVLSLPVALGLLLIWLGRSRG